MRKILSTLALLVGALQILSAIPAYPGKVKVMQPDGSVVTVQLHGDEWFHYITDERGRVVARDADGFYRPAEMPTPAQREESRNMRRAAARMRAEAKASSLTQGRHRIPVLLVNFADKEFILDDPATAFSNMLNQEGYRKYGATGSVRDYYYDNSHGAYEPVFDVYGPVTLSQESAHYAGNGGTQNVREAVREACTLLDDEIDFSQYATDGQVDMVLMYYAGYNQAEGGGAGTIWPHQSSVYGKFDKVWLGNYFCTSELRGYEGGVMCGIGTTCHEFGHSLGLPDFYDTDYEANGSAGALYHYSLMCSGSYLNDGCTPPYLNSEELKILGWMGDQTDITSAGELTIEPVQNYVAYRTATTMDGEYFVYECRNRTGWDAYLPGAGLLVYHVDKSSNPVNGYTASMLWDYWMINVFGSHPCYYLIPASAQGSLDFTGSEAEIPFPGTRRVKSYTPLDWAGEPGDFRFSDIVHDGAQVTMNVLLMAAPGVQGFVRNRAAKPIRGATVSLYAAGGAAPAKGRMRVRRATGTPVMSVTTEADGSYLLEDVSLANGTYTLSVTCDGYIEAETEVTITRRILTRDFYLRKVDEPEESTFIKYDPDGDAYYGFGYGDASYNLAAGIHLSVEETAGYAGKQIKLISFQPYGDDTSTVEEAYVFVESGGRRIFTQKVDQVRFDDLNTVNVSSQEFIIPGDTEIYIGYGLVGCSEGYPLLVQFCEEEKAGHLAEFNQTRACSWQLMYTGSDYYTPVLSASVGERVAPELGFNHIANPGNGTYAAGDRFALALVRHEDDTPSSVAWVFDGQAAEADAVTLSAGAHTIEAHLTYPDGSVEVIRLVVHAE